LPFRHVAAQPRILALLARSIRHDTLPPSLIFAGPSDAGKRAAAIAAAQALNCHAPIRSDDPRAADAVRPDSPAGFAIDACGVCIACTRIARGVHPDLLIVEPGDNGSIRIDQVRDVIDRAAYRPFEGRRRVVIVDEADTLVPAAQHALLKTLEEPPSGSIFILITARPDMLLATVRSRCPRLRFPATGIEAVDVDARAIAERVLTDANGPPAERLSVARDLLASTGTGGASDRQQLASYLRAMSTLLRDAELFWTGADAARLANPEAKGTIERLSGAYGGERGLRAFAAVDQGLAALDRNAGIKIVADWIVLNL
jgi:DNA polymerase-3 subunit delta'